MAAIREPFEVQKFYAHRFEEETLLFPLVSSPSLSPSPSLSSSLSLSHLSLFLVRKDGSIMEHLC